jgi:hypothetical protein
MHLEGMYSLISFVGSISTLMAESGLTEVMSAVFGGVPNVVCKEVSSKREGATTRCVGRTEKHYRANPNYMQA